MRASRVLIVDDSITIRAMIEEVLIAEAKCSAFAMAPDIAAARTLIDEFHPTLITLDLNMPGVGGLDFLDELRRRPHVPVVVVSSSTRDGTEATEEALAHGADACFDKARILTDAKGFVRVLQKASARKYREQRRYKKAIAEGPPLPAAA